MLSQREAGRSLLCRCEAVSRIERDQTGSVEAIDALTAGGRGPDAGEGYPGCHFSIISLCWIEV